MTFPSQDVRDSAYGELPFSTPGPGSHIAKASSPLSTDNDRLKDIYIKSPLKNDDTPVPNFIPFSTPGPGSMVAVQASNTSDAGKILPESLLATDADLESAFPQAFASISPPPPRDAPEFESTTLLPQAPRYDIAPGYSSDDYMVTNDDSYTDESNSDPPLFHDAYILPNLFATPGPGYRLPQPIYFDSPAEDPNDSDPLQSGYEIDYDALDFHWTPFDRKSTNEPEKVSLSIQPVLKETIHEEGEDEDDDVTPFATFSKETLQESKNSPGLFRFSLDDETCDEKKPTTPEPKQKSAPVFAPAPGIFISPLRNSSISESQCKDSLSHAVLVRTLLPYVLSRALLNLIIW